MLSRLIDKPWKLIVLLILETLIFLAALWCSIFIAAGNEAIYNALTILWVLFIGTTIYLYGDVTKKSRFNTAGFAFMLFVVFMTIDKFEGFAIKISAFAALLVAFAAFMSVEESRRLREENRVIRAQVVESDFKRRTLEDIVNWVIDVNKRCFPPIGIGEEAYKEWCRGISSSLGSEGKWAIRNSHIFGPEFEEKVNNLIGVIVSMNDWIKEVGDSRKFSDEEAREQLSKCFIRVLEATDSVLDAALKIKSDEKF